MKKPSRQKKRSSRKRASLPRSATKRKFRRTRASVRELAVPAASPLRLAFKAVEGTYDAGKAATFARAFWTRACPDGFVGVSGPDPVEQVHKDTQFVRTVTNGRMDEVARQPNGNEIPWKRLDDCAHFVSHCIGAPPGQTAGGLKLPSFSASVYGQLGAHRLFDVLTGRLTMIGTARMSEATASQNIGKLRSGDLIFYAPKSYGEYRHVGLYLGGNEQRITCHTYCRADVADGFPQGWDSVGFSGYPDNTCVYTFARIT